MYSNALSLIAVPPCPGALAPCRTRSRCLGGRRSAGRRYLRPRAPPRPVLPRTASSARGTSSCCAPPGAGRSPLPDVRAACRSGRDRLVRPLDELGYQEVPPLEEGPARGRGGLALDPFPVAPRRLHEAGVRQVGREPLRGGTGVEHVAPAAAEHEDRRGHGGCLVIRQARHERVAAGTVGVAPARHRLDEGLAVLGQEPLAV